MENIQAIVIGWVALQSLGITGIIWRGITFYFSHKALVKEVDSLASKSTELKLKLEKLEDKLQTKFDDIAKAHQDMRESQILQQASLEQIKQSLQMLSNQLLEKKTDVNSSP